MFPIVFKLQTDYKVFTFQNLLANHKFKIQKQKSCSLKNLILLPTFNFACKQIVDFLSCNLITLT